MLLYCNQCFLICGIPLVLWCLEKGETLGMVPPSLHPSAPVRAKGGRLCCHHEDKSREKVRVSVSHRSKTPR